MRESPGKRLLLLVLAASVALAAVSSEQFVSTHIVHHCSHTDQCRTCQDIQIARNFLSSLGLAALAFIALRAARRLEKAVRPVARFFTPCLTPVALKVKSNT
jgi:hypothetical protein